MRTTLWRTLLAISLACALAASTNAQQAKIPIHTLAPATAKTSISFVLIDAVRQLPNGNVLVNDLRGRRMFVFDSTLQRASTILDSTSGTATSYPRASAALIFYSSDSTLFYNLDSQTLALIEPNGTLGRAVAAPNTQTGINLLGTDTRPGMDPLGRLIYRGPQTLHLLTGPGGLPATSPAKRDSAAIVRADFNTRALDTIAWITIPAGTPMIWSTDARTKKPTARLMQTPVAPPFDDMAVLSNGTIAILRGQDYHIDWILADGTRRSTGKMPYDWRQLTDEEKQAKIDSARRIVDSVQANRPPRPILWPNADGMIDTILPTVEFVPVSEVPDYMPAIRVHALKPDADGNLWILPTTSAQAKGGLLYDVVNQNGEIFQRVQLPAQCDIVGFGKGGVVYLSLREGQRYYIQRTHIQP